MERIPAANHRGHAGGISPAKPAIATSCIPSPPLPTAEQAECIVREVAALLFSGAVSYMPAAKRQEKAIELGRVASLLRGRA